MDGHGGLTLMVVGLFNKLVIADTLVSGIADKVFAVGYQPSILAAWTGAAAFSIQIFCDFSGYSTCAIGVALCLGLVLPDNFRFPYASVGFSDFWRRWHISLSGWLRDYLYISLGGNRKGPIRTMVNLALTMLIGGLWHGASWMFVIWGALHGAALVAERLLRANIPKSPIWSTLPAQLLLAGLTYIFVLYTWVFFRAGTLDSAWTIVSAMSGFASTAAESLGTTRVLTVWVVTAVMLALHWRLRGSSLEAAVQSLPAWLRPLSLAVMMILILLSMAGENSAFIYFQF